MIAKVVTGWRPAGLIAYLLGPGEHEEHRNPRVVASWDGAPAFHQPPKTGPGEFDFDLRELIGVMQELPKEFGLPLANPAPTPEGLPNAQEWMQWLRIAGRRKPPSLAPDWLKLYRYDPKAQEIVLKDGYVWHCPVRLHPDDPVLSDKQWEHIAQRLMDATGIHQAGCRWIAVRHADDHIHLMAVLVAQHESGRLTRFSPPFYKTRLREACQELEREFGLTPTPGIDRTAAKQPTRGEISKANRNRRSETARSELHRLISQAAASTHGSDRFFAKLDELQINYRLSYTATGRIRGCAYATRFDQTRGGELVWFGGGKLAADLTWPKLLTRWNSTPAADTSVERTNDGRSTPHARQDVLAEATAVVNAAAAAIRTKQEDPDGIAHAVGELLGTLALGKEYRTPGPLTTAHDYYDRAARSPHRVLAHDLGPLARELRRAARKLAAIGAIHGRGSERFVLAALVLALAGLIAEICAWQQANARVHQAAAAERTINALPIDRVAAARAATVHARRSAPIPQASPEPVTQRRYAPGNRPTVHTPAAYKPPPRSTASRRAR
ncbi:relaxase/mobilization nuclease domain-containing protein [Saccharothrix sp. AJ9571]|nr:relaxase/mobilization nuclease domain-containing protein [Saccharothrix sp. AJ9571]